jgi:hypothetical protein
MAGIRRWHEITHGMNSHMAWIHTWHEFTHGMNSHMAGIHTWHEFTHGMNSHMAWNHTWHECVIMYSVFSCILARGSNSVNVLQIFFHRVVFQPGRLELHKHPPAQWHRLFILEFVSFLKYERKLSASTFPERKKCKRVMHFIFFVKMNLSIHIPRLDLTSQPIIFYIWIQRWYHYLSRPRHKGLKHRASLKKIWIQWH